MPETGPGKLCPAANKQFLKLNSLIMKQIKNLLVIFLSAVIFISCKKAEINTQRMNLNITGLEDLGPNFRYEGWLMVSGTPVSAGIFSVNTTGALSQTAFDINKDQLAAATDYILTIEPFPDTDPAPTSTHILAGSFATNTATISTNDAKALGTNFSAATGKYILATPTDGAANNEKSGLWFIDISGGAPMAGLNLPTLPVGWVYEGWAVIGGKAITSGHFTSTTAADQSAPFSGTVAAGPAFPGEDYLMNAPVGFTFPTDLSGGLAVISVEPQPDNSPAPFLLKPLLANIPAAALDHVTYNMGLNTVSLPSGTVSR